MTVESDPVIVALAAHLGQLLPDMPLEDRARFAQAIRGGEPYVPGPDAVRRDGLPRGERREGVCPAGVIYPGLEHHYTLYVPAQYDGASDAALMVFQDGARYLGPECDATAVLDNLIAAGDMPATVAVFVEPGARGPGLPVYGGSDNRSIEYDRLGDDYARFLLGELIPHATQGLRITSDPALRALCGLSSGGICAFNVAWERPGSFGKVISHCGSFVDLRGGHLVAPAVRAAPQRPLRVFLQSGANDLDIRFGNWLLANQTLASALAYRGYDHQLVIGSGGHSLAHGGAIFPDTLRWLFRDWRAAHSPMETTP